VDKGTKVKLRANYLFQQLTEQSLKNLKSKNFLQSWKISLNPNASANKHWLSTVTH